MKKQFKVVCRGSMLSQAQADLFKNKLLAIIPEARVDVIIKDTEGDRNQLLALQELEGKDFFTRDIQDFLVSGQADFAVHSLKDVSGQNFFQGNHFAIIEREDPRDVAIFNKGVLEKISGGQLLRIGTSSPRRVLMATGFLRRALPVVDGQVASVQAIPIRGNVDTRLRKLFEQQYDGIILAVAGLNRLLRYEPSKNEVDRLLKDKLIMVLPIFECPPAPGQGAIVAETTPENTSAVDLLQKLNRPELVEATRKEREFASQYGSGCHQQFGVVHIDGRYVSFTYGSGVHRDTTAFSHYRYEKKIDAREKRIFSAGDLMKNFFFYRFIESPQLDAQGKSFFVASHKAIHSSSLLRELSSKSIWAAGTKTWYQLAQKGLWVEGCADGLGLEFITPWLESPLIKISKPDLQILTDIQSAEHWRVAGWKAAATYELFHEVNDDLVESMSRADVIFWTSFRQFIIYRKFLKENVTHCCASGKTVEFFRREGIQPVVFPGINAFNEWRKTNTTSVTEG